MSIADASYLASGSYLASRFGRELRKNGVNIGLFDVLAFIKALGTLGIHGQNNTYWAGRITLIKNPSDIPIYEKVFNSFWLSHGEDKGGDLGAFLEEDKENEIPNLQEIPDLDPNVDQDINQEDNTITIRYSPTETLLEKDFAKYSPEEMLEARKAISQIRISIPERTSRRLSPGKSKTSKLNMGKIARMATQTQGEAIRQAFLERKKTKRRLILILDISGSMETYSRVLLRFAHSAKSSHHKVEVFVLSTRLTRITKELSINDPDQALEKVSSAVKDWSGGTRLGEGLLAFNNIWGLKGMARGATIIISSDGWDRGDPEQLAEQMQRLSRVAHKIVWVNPLKATPGYEPLAKGMAVALPFIDNFVEGHSLYSFEHLAGLIKE